MAHPPCTRTDLGYIGQCGTPIPTVDGDALVCRKALYALADEAEKYAQTQEHNPNLLPMAVVPLSPFQACLGFVSLDRATLFTQVASITTGRLTIDPVYISEVPKH